MEIYRYIDRLQEIDIIKIIDENCIAKYKYQRTINGNVNAKQTSAMSAN